MGKSSGGQVTGYRYFTNFLMFIGNPIEKMLGINFDKRGWISPFVDENGNALAQGVINSPNLYGENEGGVAGTVHVQYGRDNQEVLPFYKSYMESKGLPASSFPFQSYLAFTGIKFDLSGTIGAIVGSLMPYSEEAFYVGNSGYMKEMLLWPKRTRIRNDGRRQWYEMRGDGAIVCEIGSGSELQILSQQAIADINNTEWVVQDQNLGTVHINRYPANYLEYYFSTGTVVGAIGSVIANVNFSEPLDGGYFFVYASLGQDGDLYVTDVEAIILIRNDPMEGWGRAKTWLVILKKGIKSTEIKVDVVCKGSPNHRVYLTVAYQPSEDIYEYSYDSFDINPIHKIREILTDDTAMNKPESSINDENFIKAADRIYDERLGISWSITEKSCIDAINELCYHIEAGIRVNRQTGLYEMVLFRDDWFEEDEIHNISESKIKSMQYEITNADEVINQVNVNFYDRANIKNSSFSISESGLIQTLGRVNAETVDFPYFMNMRNAEIVANWKLKLLSTGVYKGTFTTGWREARKWNRYDLIRLPWSRRWIGTILVRIMSINLGGPTNNEVSIDFIEVVPSTGMMNTTIVADDVIDKPLPPQSCQYEPFELPYYLAVMALGQRQVDDELTYENNFGLVGAVAEKPQENSLYAVMMTNNGDEWIRAGSIQYSITADLDQIISKTSSSFIVKNWKKIANIPAGTLIKCGRDWLGTPGEWMVFQGVDPYTGIITVKRGALDTLPQEWGVDTKLYFCGNDISYDQTEYISSEEVLVSALTTTPLGVLEQGGSIPVEMKARAIRPYPPANVKINDMYWPTEIETDLVLTWVDRNRVQQTGGSILGWYEGGVTVESGAVYVVQVFDANNQLISSENLGAVNSCIVDYSSVTTERFKLKLFSKRDTYVSMQAFEIDILNTNYLSKPKNITAEYAELYRPEQLKAEFDNV